LELVYIYIFFRFVFGGFILAGIKTGFKPLFYLVAGSRLEGAEKWNLHKQRSQKAQWIEVLYKVSIFIKTISNEFTTQCFLRADILAAMGLIKFCAA
jgi:hypothetical protein